MHDPILVINAGSSSLKFSVFETTAPGALLLRVHGQVESVNGESRLSVSDANGNALANERVKRGGDEAIRAIQHWFAGHAHSQGFAGVGHRIVHGGASYSQPVLIDGDVIAALQQLVPLAPLHEPQQIAAIRAFRAISPHVPQVACFDTAFHSSQPAIARAFALPREYSARGLRRYGFHGLSYEYIVSALPTEAPECVGRKLIVAHLGNGASLCAIRDGRSMATTMGLTALDGLMMGTRCGALDPGVILYLLQHEHLGAGEIERLLYERSGLLGVSGMSADMRELLASDRPEAAEAIELFTYRISREIGSLAAALGGLDALIFTGGIGEHAPPIRARVCAQAAWLGVTLDGSANERSERRISGSDGRVSAWVIPTDENLMVARHTRRLIEASASRSKPLTTA
jgi:acetate kinase